MPHIQKVTGEFYLVIHRKNYSDLSARLATRSPALEANEVAIKLSVSVPGTLFKQPQLQATVTIPENAVTPPVLDASVLDNVREIMEQKTGMAVNVRLVGPE